MTVVEPVNIVSIYNQINQVATNDTERESMYSEVVEMELDRFIEAFKTAIQKKLNSTDILQGMAETNQLQELFGVLFMAAKPEHRVKMSYLYDEFNAIFGMAKTEIERQTAHS
jgi:hypothetical protein